MMVPFLQGLVLLSSSSPVLFYAQCKIPHTEFPQLAGRARIQAYNMQSVCIELPFAERALFSEISQLTQEHSDREEPPPFFEGIQTDLSPLVFVLRLSFILQVASSEMGSKNKSQVPRLPILPTDPISRHLSLFGEQKKVSNSSMVLQVIPVLLMTPTEENSVSTGSCL